MSSLVDGAMNQLRWINPEDNASEVLHFNLASKFVRHPQQRPLRYASVNSNQRKARQRLLNYRTQHHLTRQQRLPASKPVTAIESMNFRSSPGERQNREIKLPTTTRIIEKQGKVSERHLIPVSIDYAVISWSCAYSPWVASWRDGNTEPDRPKCTYMHVRSNSYTR